MAPGDISDRERWCTVHGDARQKLFTNLDQQVQAQPGNLKPVT
jgi:hypothetical protein